MVLLLAPTMKKELNFIEVRGGKKWREIFKLRPPLPNLSLIPFPYFLVEKSRWTLKRALSCTSEPYLPKIIFFYGNVSNPLCSAALGFAWPRSQRLRLVTAAVSTSHNGPPTTVVSSRLLTLQWSGLHYNLWTCLVT